MSAPVAPMIDPRLKHHPSSMTQRAQSTDQIELATPQNSESLRALPLIDIKDETIDDAYVQFILFCNPSIPLSTDSTELRRGFRSPPKSDGKTFNSFALFELIKRLESKELSTWTQLVIELGVEPPDASKNQSTQKVQQYAVRLKVTPAIHSINS